jgi:hypothetical protein
VWQKLGFECPLPRGHNRPFARPGTADKGQLATNRKPGVDGSSAPTPAVRLTTTGRLKSTGFVRPLRGWSTVGLLYFKQPTTLGSVMG